MRYFLHYVWQIKVGGAAYESSNEITESTANSIMEAENVSLTDEEKDKLNKKGDILVLIKKAENLMVLIHIYAN